MNYDLDKFLIAQHGVYETAFNEIKSGKKISHWMWFIFPQIMGLGKSEMAKRFALHDLSETDAYLKHPVLGARLKEITREVMKLEHRSANEIFGHPDDLKFQSCMTLFSLVSGDQLFSEAVLKYFNGVYDHKTLRIINVSS